MRKVVAYSKLTTNYGRLYPNEILLLIADQINSKGGFLGELNHSENTYVDLLRVAHKVTDAKVENEELSVEVEIMNTPNGAILSSLIDEVVFRLRGTGTVNDVTNVVESDYDLITIDAIPFHEDPYFGARLKPFFL